MNYKICSWDVGIKNLSYCIISKSNNILSIEKWDIINLIEEQPLICGVKLKNKDVVCGKKASFYGINWNNKITYYCRLHKDNYKPIEDNWENLFIDKLETIQTCSYLFPKKGYICGKKALFKSNNLFYCHQHIKQILEKKKKEMQLKIIKKKKCSSLDPQMICKSIHNKLDSISELLQVNEVVIENQPSFKNPIMKTISSFLFSYFIMKGIIDKSKTGSIINTVRFVSPTVKININEDLINFVNNQYETHMKTIKNKNKNKNKNNNKNNHHCRLCKLLNEINKNKEKYGKHYKKYRFSYETTKELGIQYTFKLLKEYNFIEKIEYLNNHKKKDDLCDSFLHCFKQIDKIK